MKKIINLVSYFSAIYISILIIKILFYNVPSYSNNKLILNKNTKIEKLYENEEVFYNLKSSNIDTYAYIKNLTKLDDKWIGEIYNFDDIIEQNFEFRIFAFHLVEKIEGNFREKYNKNAGYFIISDKEEIYGLTKEEFLKILNFNQIVHKNIDFYIEQKGTSKDLDLEYQRYIEKISELTKITITRYPNMRKEDIDREIKFLLFFKNTLIIFFIFNIFLIFNLFVKEKFKKILFQTQFKIKSLNNILIVDLFLLLPVIIILKNIAFLQIILKNIFLAIYLKKKCIVKKYILLFHWIAEVLFSLVLFYLKEFLNREVSSFFYYLIYIFSLIYFYYCVIKKYKEQSFFFLTIYMILQILYIFTYIII